MATRTITKSAVAAKPVTRKPIIKSTKPATESAPPVPADMARKPVQKPAAATDNGHAVNLSPEALKAISEAVSGMITEHFAKLTDKLVALAAANASTAAVAEPATEAPKPTARTRAKAAPTEFDAAAREAALLKMTVVKLKALAEELGFEEDGLKGATKEELVTAILPAEVADAKDAGLTVVNYTEPESDDDEEPEDDEVEEAEDEEDSDDDEEAEEDADEEEDPDAEAEEEAEEEELPTREQLMDPKQYSLSELKKFVRAEFDMTKFPGDLAATKDRAAIVNYVLGDEVDDEDDEEVDGEDEGALTEDDLRAMSLAELKAVYTEYLEAKPKPNMKQEDIIQAILDLAEAPF